MLGFGFMDEVDMINNCGGLFDQIDDFLNFPCEDINGGFVVGGGCDGGFKDAWTSPPQHAFKKSGLMSDGSGAGSELSSEVYVQYDDIVQLEWLPNIVEGSFSDKSIVADKASSSSNNSIDNQNDAIKNSSQTMTINEDSLSTKSIAIDNDSSSDNNWSNDHSRAINNIQFRTSSPVSVLESSSSTSEKVNVISPETVVPGRARSKRPRPVTFSIRSVIPLISPTSSISSPSVSITSLDIPSEYDNFAESQPELKIPKFTPAEQKKTKKKKKVPPLASAVDPSASPRPIAVRKCMHCEITKTPQWRAGPMGPKTLCNACGVRFKSGRLFPEYRPAASPTFVPTLHSNSHKKVLEMRIKEETYEMASDAAEAAAVPELIPNRSHFLDYI
ncbi:hypothetical protein Scep_004974 [Stephania cephalantha]|uniref:GATA-type domain-containing protein n=1 Tax=Stephania cephalantha TaxID=152367 RepID=A0AAP0KVY9_9MAGN